MKKEKIIITGGLGYIGVELCKLYSGEARYKDITVIDSRFVSARVKQLRDWGIKFVQTNLFNEEALQRELKDSDVIIHLAGITDVAYTQTESNTEQDNRIKKVGIEGTRNIIKLSPASCKIIFPSTHVVYEGLKDTRLDILETEPPRPVLTYAKGKVQSEKDLAASNKNYVILRLGSVYGYSLDTTRMNIMPNLFSKIASQEGTISLYSGGVQIKSLVPLLDVARCLKFMAEKDDICRETFHCSKENMTVKEVAQLCHQFSPRLTLLETEDEVPNLGYTLSNKKLLSTGFEFLHNIEDSIKEMVDNWSARKTEKPLEHIIKGSDHYTDDRGEIANYELPEAINLVGHISSRAGTVRANHYHPIQEQKCLLVKGQYISIIKDLSNSGTPLETKIINKGDLSVIQPNVAHTMVFTQDSIFLNLIQGDRDHDKYGVTHTIPYPLVNQETASRLIENCVAQCRSCSSLELQRVISLGESPLANNLIDTPEENYETYPLEMEYCPACHNCQLSYKVDPSKMFDNYLYVSSTSPKFRKHFEDAAQKYIKEFGLSDTSTVVDIGSNDGIALKPLLKAGIKAVGVEPARNIAKIANQNNIATIHAYFNDTIASKILLHYGKVDLVTASNVFAHSDELKNITVNAFNILKERGTFIIEVQYLLDTIETLTFDNIYHEHVNYWSVTALKNFFIGLGFHMTHVEHLDTHGGSIRVYVSREDKADDAVVTFLDNERAAGVPCFSYYEGFSSQIDTLKKNVRINMDLLKEEHKKIAGYAAPAKATTALNYFGITSKDIEYIVEDNPLKHNKFIPGTGIPIKNKDYCYNNLPEVIIVMAWNFFDSIVSQNQELVDKGVQFININQLYKLNESST
tara:strand:- start:4396 stop:6975 length:2580 start_codon:yes stop_codon:yes gene_type:complete